MSYKSRLVSLSHVPIGLGYLLLQLPHPNHLTLTFVKTLQSQSHLVVSCSPLRLLAGNAVQTLL